MPAQDWRGLDGWLAGCRGEGVGNVHLFGAFYGAESGLKEDGRNPLEAQWISSWTSMCEGIWEITYPGFEKDS